MMITVAKFLLRLISLAAFSSALLVLSYPLGREGNFLLWFSRFDPWLLFSQWHLGKFPNWLWLPLLVLLLTIWQGRWFCQFLCPFGALMASIDFCGQRLLGKKNQWIKSHIFHSLQKAAPYFLAILLVLFVVEPSWVLYFTPFAILSQGIVQFSKEEWPVLLLSVLLITFLFSRMWCAFLCPTGILFTLVTQVKALRYQRIHSGKLASSPFPAKNLPSRRQFLKIMAVAVLAGAALKNIANASTKVLRPPGALPVDEFSAACNRCGRCLQVCPTNALWPMPLTQGLIDFETPEFIPREGRCDLCHACQEICPTGALVFTSIPQTKIGKAQVDKNRCLAWHDEKLCFLCGEQCPIQAIDGDELRRPIIQHDKCIGCGACENGCPVDGEAAIRVFPEQ